MKNKLRVFAIVPHADRLTEQRGHFLPLRLLAERGFADTALLTNGTPNNQNFTSLWNGLVPVIRSRLGPWSWWSKFGLALQIMNPNLHVDVFFLRPWSYWKRAVILARYFLGSKYIVWLDTYKYERQKSWKARLYHEFRYGLLLRHANLIIGETPEVTQIAAKRLPKVRVVHLPIGLDVSSLQDLEQRWKEADRSPVRSHTILFVGRMSEEKRTHLAVESFLQLADQFPDWRLKLIGPALFDDKNKSDYLNKMMHTIDSSQFKDRIEYIPKLFGDDLYREYASSSIYILPSTSEGISTTVMEAMYFGGAILCTRSGVIDWMLDEGKAGIVLDQQDEQGITDTLQLLMSDANRREQLMTHARQRVVEYLNWDKIIITFESEISRLVQPQETNGEIPHPGAVV